MLDVISRTLRPRGGRLRPNVWRCRSYCDKIERTNVWLQANECESFVQAVEAVERLHDFTPFIADLVDEGDRPNAARSYFAKVLYGPSLLATPASARPHHATTSAAAAPSG